MWCHVLLASPVLGLLLFFVLPFPVALTLYLVLILISFALYYKIMESMHAAVVTGAEALIGQIVTTGVHGDVHWRGEWWTATPPIPERPVRIVALQGLCLQVEPVSTVVTTPNHLDNEERSRSLKSGEERLIHRLP